MSLLPTTFLPDTKPHLAAVPDTIQDYIYCRRRVGSPGVYLVVGGEFHIQLFRGLRLCVLSYVLAYILLVLL
jgi:hypothetical protein